jgi:DNA-binding transcriptional LysR family regulator
VRDELSVLSAFLTVAEERSFTRAAKRLNISTSGLSHAIRRLEEQIGVRLLTRTTRSVSPTEAGERLLAQLRPALFDIRGTLMELSGLQSTPVGRIRLLCPRLAAKTVVGPKLGQFVRDYPGVELDITTDDSRVDLVSAGYDAGIQFGEYHARHGDRAGLPGSPAGHRRRARIFQLTPQADLSTRPAATSMHPFPGPRGERVQVGTR